MGALIPLWLAACAADRTPQTVDRAALMAATPLVPKASLWKYVDDGSDQGTAWRTPLYNDGAWRTGRAKLGYGNPDQTTLVSFGPNPKDKYVTTYFRHTFTVPDPARFADVILRVLMNDAGVVYVNGTEIFRSNMPAGAITARTRALREAVDNLFLIRKVSPALLVPGANVIAAEVHQLSASSPSLSFELEVNGSEDLLLERGPYLQMGAPTRAVIRWRTDLPSDSRVRYGASHTTLTTVVDDASLTTEHEVALSNLTPATKYFYSVGTQAGALAGEDPSFFFITPPRPGTTKPTRIWAIGDAGVADLNAAAVADAYRAHANGRPTDLWLMLGDNAYNEGTDDQYQKAVFEMYPDLLRQTFLWPTIGNHETAGLAMPDSIPYLDIFTLPTAGEVGGLPSGTEKYYSFTYGNIHFVCLDSMTSDRLPGGAMLTWLQNDLATDASGWLIAYWHHPPYSKGNHDSDVEIELVEMRQNVLPILEEHGVDLILSGHSHDYERTGMLDGHYGVSGTLDPRMQKNLGSGRPDEGGAYLKATPGPAAHEGAVYVVAGSAGLVTLGTPLDHPAMFINLRELGSLVLDVDGNTLEASFLRETGQIQDRFTIVKGAPLPTTPPKGPSVLSAVSRSANAIALTWRDNAADEAGFKIERAAGDDAFAEIVALGANATRFVDVGLTADTAYRYRARAYNAAGPSGYSNITGATTGSCAGRGACPDAAADAQPDASNGDGVTLPDAVGADTQADANADQPTRPISSAGCSCGVGDRYVAGGIPWLVLAAGLARISQRRLRRPAR